ncbi:MAG: hypothetical protein ACXWZP_05825, partial [Gaiellaceae bacterium]
LGRHTLEDGKAVSRRRPSRASRVPSDKALSRSVRSHDVDGLVARIGARERDPAAAGRPAGSAVRDLGRGAAGQLYDLPVAQPDREQPVGVVRLGTGDGRRERRALVRLRVRLDGAALGPQSWRPPGAR